MGLSAVLALLIGIVVGVDSPLDAPVEAPLAPVSNGAPGERGSERRGRSTDNETFATMPPGMGTVTIERRIIIRIPTLRAPQAQADMRGPEVRGFVAPPSVPPQPAARQRSTCLALRSIKGASMQERTGIQFVTTDDSRYEAVLERGCRPVDFQSGFYLGATPDGAICPGRDTLHARSGLHCAIVGFKRLAPEM